MKKTILIVLGILVLVGAGVWYSYYNFNKPLPVKEIKDSPFSILLQNATDTFAESKDWYEVKLDYPKNAQIVRDDIFSKWEVFNKEFKLDTYANFAEASSSLGLFAPEQKYSFFATFDMKTSTNTVSYVYNVYEYTAGAHGSTTIYPITLDEKLQIVPVSKILHDDKLEKASKIALAEIIKQRTEVMKSFNMSAKEIADALKDDEWMKEGTKPIRDNYSSVWIDGDNIVINFGQYQVASYAEGMFDVKIPISELNN